MGFLDYILIYKIFKSASTHNYRPLWKLKVEFLTIDNDFSRVVGDHMLYVNNCSNIRKEQQI